MHLMANGCELSIASCPERNALLRSRTRAHRAKHLRTFECKFYRAPHIPRCECRDQHMRPRMPLAAEASPDKLRDYAHVLFWDSEDARQFLLVAGDVLRGVVQRKPIAIPTCRRR